MADLEQIGLAAVDRFITTWNSRDPVKWAASLNFPHVRPAPSGRILVAADADEYVSRVDFDKVVATGWDHSEWDFRQVVHKSASKIHVVGQWSRYTKAGEKFLTNPVVYIVTKMKEGWGIQSRFSADYAGDDDTSGLESRAFKLFQTFAQAVSEGRRDAAAELINTPYFGIGVGALTEVEERSGFSLPWREMKIDSMIALQAGHSSINLAADLVIDGGRSVQCVCNLTIQGDHLGIQAMSVADPNEEDQS